MGPTTARRNGIIYIVLSAFAAIVLLPFFWTVYASLVENDLLVYQFPTDPSVYGTSNFSFIIDQSLILRWYGNSIVVTGVILIGNLAFNTAAGYALARIRFPGRKVLFGILLALMMVPPQVLFVPIFMLVSEFGWLNTYMGLTVPFLVNPFGAFLMRQFFVDFPQDLDDAGRLDGLTTFGVFRRLALPLALPALVTQTIFIFVWNWNNFVFPSVLATTPEMFTLPVGIYQITTTSFSNQVAKSMAGVVMMTIPTIALFAFLQRYFVRSLAGTGIH